MNIKRFLLVSVSIIGLLAVALGAVGFVLTSNSSAKADEALSNPPAALSAEQATSDREAKYEANIAGTKDSTSGFNDYSSGGSGCSHDQAIDWYADD